VKKEYSLLLGERTSEAIKLAIASVFPTPDELVAEIKGRDLVSGLPKTITISAEEVRRAIEEPVNAIIDAIKTTLDRTPPELAAARHRAGFGIARDHHARLPGRRRGPLGRGGSLGPDRHGSSAAGCLNGHAPCRGLLLGARAPAFARA